MVARLVSGIGSAAAWAALSTCVSSVQTSVRVRRGSRPDRSARLPRDPDHAGLTRDPDHDHDRRSPMSTTTHPPRRREAVDDDLAAPPVTTTDPRPSLVATFNLDGEPLTVAGA